MTPPPSAEEVLALMLSELPPLATERVSLGLALRSVLREEIRADRDLPAFTRSAVDGYAIRQEDSSPHFRIIEEIQAGATSTRPLQVGECARIFTGAQLPEGASQVLMQEEVKIEKAIMTPNSRTSAHNIRNQGEDAKAGEILLRSGERLGAPELAVLAGVGVTQPLVTQPVRVAHWVTGNEIIFPDQTPTGSQIRDTNSILMESLLTHQGARIVHQGHLPDQSEATQQALKAYGPDEADLLLLSGGASVGDYDFGRPALEAIGFEIKIQKVNLRPGKPLIFATRGKQRAMVIPGNPVSHFVIYHRFIAPLLAAWEGAPMPDRSMRGQLAEAFEYRANPRTTAWPAQACWKNDHWSLHPLRWMSSGDIRSLIGCNALLHFTDQSGALPVGTPIEFLPTFLTW